jgi:hypothetical protein
MNPGKPDASAKHPRKAHPETLVPSVCSTTAEDELDTGAEVRLEVELGFKVEVVEFVFGTEVVLEVNFSEVEVSFSEVEVVFVVDSVLEFLWIEVEVEVMVVLKSEVVELSWATAKAAKATTINLVNCIARDVNM